MLLYVRLNLDIRWFIGLIRMNNQVENEAKLKAEWHGSFWSDPQIRNAFSPKLPTRFRFNPILFVIVAFFLSFFLHTFLRFTEIIYSPRRVGKLWEPRHLLTNLFHIVIFRWDWIIRTFLEMAGKWNVVKKSNYASLNLAFKA